MLAHSETIALISSAISKAQSEVENATKRSNNPAFRSKYADLAEILDTVRPVFASHGLALTQHPGFEDGRVIVETMISHTSGEWMTSKLAMPLSKNDAHGMGSAITYARRYALAAICGIHQEDDDGNASVKPARQVRQEAIPAQEAPQTADVPDPVEWTDDERSAAAGMVADLAEALLEAGMAHEDMQRVIGKPSSKIGDPEMTLNTWTNRILTLRERELKKLEAV